MLQSFRPRRCEPYLEKLAEMYSAVLVTGPRQAGKTALVRHCFPEHEWILFDDALLASQANSDPQLFLQNYSPPFILDEIQKAPGIFPALKEKIDRGEAPKGSIILTGSQPLPLMQLVTESLAGRIGLVSLLPMTPAEAFQYSTKSFSFNDWIEDPPVGETFPWQESPIDFLFRGGFPQMTLKEYSATSDEAAIRLKDYTQTYLSKDLRDISFVSDLGRFERFLRVLASYSGKITELSNIARAADIPQGSAHDWLSLATASLVHWSAPGYSVNLGKRERKRPKGFLIDSGLICNLMSVQSVEGLRKNPLSGFIMESAVANAFRALLFRSSTATVPIYHWNFKNQKEVDLVVEHDGGKLYPIEVKLTANPESDTTSGLESFAEVYGDQVAMKILVTTNERCFWLAKDTLHVPFSAL